MLHFLMTYLRGALILSSSIEDFFFYMKIKERRMIKM